MTAGRRGLAGFMGAVLVAGTLAMTAAGGAAAADAQTAGELAAAGAQVYAAECAVCHGKQGEGYIGPAVMGEGAALAPYGTAQRLYEYTSTVMPQAAPGSLTDQQYLQVIAYILVESGFVDKNQPLTIEKLADIELK